MEKDKASMSEQQKKTKKPINYDMLKKSEFIGTDRRKKTMSVIMQLCRELLPLDESEAVNIISFRTGLTTRKIEEDYIAVLKSIKFLDTENFALKVGEHADEIDTKV